MAISLTVISKDPAGTSDPSFDITVDATALESLYSDPQRMMWEQFVAI
ncbi:hypothetical protein KIF59_23040 [Enterobacter cloacae subsp. cloacae]|nr:hypothetical protein [Enterobacter cloacae subsp. cloacae]